MQKTLLRSPEAVRGFLSTRYRSQRRNWLRAVSDAEGGWPIVLNLGNPTEEDAVRQPGALAAWIDAWRAWRGPGDLTWTERRWRGLGLQSLPETLSVRSAEDVAAWVGEDSRWARARVRYAALLSRWPALRDVLPRYFEVLADYSVEDFDRLETLLGWLVHHPATGLYPRQLPIPGVDSKWLETRASLLRDWVSLARDGEASTRDFHEVCGLRGLPHLLRLRILDASLRARLGGMRDLSLPEEELAALDLPAARVYIVENLQTGLAFGELPGSVVFMRLGYGADVLGGVPWVRRADCVYWGDLDTHGFRILGRLRAVLPHARSVLMDEETLLSHRALWGEEAEQAADPEVAGLVAAEQALYRRLKQHYWGVNVRLEQERIAWEYAWSELSGDASPIRL